MTYVVQPYDGMYWHFKGPGGVEVREETTGEWVLDNGESRFDGWATWPWDVTEWQAFNDGEGTPVFTRAVPDPVSLALDGATAAEAAVLATSLAGSNKDLVFTSKLPGRLGNDVTVRYLNPGMINATLAVSVSGRDITVRLATNGGGGISSTATQVRTAVQANAAASALVTVANKAGSDGTGVVTAMNAMALGGGTGGLPLPPVAMALG